MEEWRDIEGFEGLYQVSNEGRVKSLERTIIRSNGAPFYVRERFLKFGINCEHYTVTLANLGKHYHPLVHRLVAEAFIPNPNNYDIVHHIDHNPKNNKVENLMWISKEKHDEIHINERKKEIHQYNKQGELVKIWGSANECDRNGYWLGAITACCRGERKTHKGFIWKYA